MKSNTNTALRYSTGALTGLASLLLSAASGQAQTLPSVDAGSLLQQQQQNQPNRLPAPPKPDLKPLSKPELPAQSPQGPEADKTTIVVKTFTLTGPITAFAPEQLQAALAGFVNRPLSLTELQEAAAAITQLYRQGGYFLARAYLPKQDVTAGTVTIAITEGVLDANNGVFHVTGQQRCTQHHGSMVVALAVGRSFAPYLIAARAHSTGATARFISQTQRLEDDIHALLHPGIHTDRATPLALRLTGPLVGSIQPHLAAQTTHG
jgi:hypothetical protein